MAEPRRRIDFLSPPFKGHLHPILAMARTACARFDVRVVSTRGARADIQAAGLAGVALDCLDDADLRPITDPPYANGSNPIRLKRQFEAVLAALELVHEELVSRYTSDRPDLIVADFTLPVALPVAGSINVPCWTSLPSPCVLESSAGVPAYLGGWNERPGWPFAMRDTAGRTMVRLFKSSIFRLYRGRIQRAGIHQLYRADGTESAYSGERILCLGWPDLEFRKNWPAAAQFIGPMLYTPPSAAEPEFEAGKRHVLVTLGTHLGWRKDALADQVRAIAAAMPDCVFHFSDGNAGGPPGAGASGANFQRHAYINYDTCIGRYDLVVHHGGAGILYHCLKQGVPAVVFPIDYDQFDHAARLARAGVAVRIQHARQLDASLLDRVLHDGEIRRRCMEQARALQAFCAAQDLPAMFSAHLDGPMAS